MKRLITCLLVLATVLTAASCTKRTAKNSPEETFSTPDIAITLSTAFKEVKTNEYTACFEASDVTVYLIQEKFEDLTEEQAAIEVEDYAELVRANNISKNPSEISVSEDTGLVTMEYSYQDPTSGVTYKTFSAMYRSTNSFWTVQFCCEEAIYADYTELFTKWAQSVFFTLKDQNYIINKELMITLTEGFVKTDLADFRSANRVVNAKTEELIANYVSDDGKITINFKKESKADAGVNKLSAFADTVYTRYENQGKINNLKNITKLSKTNGLYSFEFEFSQAIPNPVNPQQNTTSKYKYFVFCVEDTKNFWTIEIACAEKEFENYRESITKWAQSVVFEWEAE